MRRLKSRFFILLCVATEAGRLFPQRSEFFFYLRTLVDIDYLLLELVQLNDIHGVLEQQLDLEKRLSSKWDDLFRPSSEDSKRGSDSELNFSELDESVAGYELKEIGEELCFMLSFLFLIDP